MICRKWTLSLILMGVLVLCIASSRYQGIDVTPPQMFHMIVICLILYVVIIFCFPSKMAVKRGHYMCELVMMDSVQCNQEQNGISYPTLSLFVIL
jgi:hypothetical protein